MVTKGMEYANWASLGHVSIAEFWEWTPPLSEPQGIHPYHLSRQTVILSEFWFPYLDFEPYIPLQKIL